MDKTISERVNEQSDKMTADKVSKLTSMVVSPPFESNNYPRHLSGLLPFLVCAENYGNGYCPSYSYLHAHNMALDNAIIRLMQVSISSYSIPGVPAYACFCGEPAQSNCFEVFDQMFNTSTLLVSLDPETNKVSLNLTSSSNPKSFGIVIYNRGHYTGCIPLTKDGFLVGLDDTDSSQHFDMIFDEFNSHYRNKNKDNNLSKLSNKIVDEIGYSLLNGSDDGNGNPINRIPLFDINCSIKHIHLENTLIIQQIADIIMEGNRDAVSGKLEGSMIGDRRFRAISYSNYVYNHSDSKSLLSHMRDIIRKDMKLGSNASQNDYNILKGPKEFVDHVSSLDDEGLMYIGGLLVEAEMSLNNLPTNMVKFMDRLESLSRIKSKIGKLDVFMFKPFQLKARSLEGPYNLCKHLCGLITKVSKVDTVHQYRLADANNKKLICFNKISDYLDSNSLPKDNTGGELKKKIKELNDKIKPNTLNLFKPNLLINLMTNVLMINNNKTEIFLGFKKGTKDIADDVRPRKSEQKQMTTNRKIMMKLEERRSKRVFCDVAKQVGAFRGQMVAFDSFDSKDDSSPRQKAAIKAIKDPDYIRFYDREVSSELKGTSGLIQKVQSNIKVKREKENRREAWSKVSLLISPDVPSDSIVTIKTDFIQGRSNYQSVVSKIIDMNTKHHNIISSGSLPELPTKTILEAFQGMTVKNVVHSLANYALKSGDPDKCFKKENDNVVVLTVKDLLSKIKGLKLHGDLKEKISMISLIFGICESNLSSKTKTTWLSLCLGVSYESSDIFLKQWNAKHRLVFIAEGENTGPSEFDFLTSMESCSASLYDCLMISGHSRSNGMAYKLLGYLRTISAKKSKEKDQTFYKTRLEIIKSYTNNKSGLPLVPSEVLNSVRAKDSIMCNIAGLVIVMSNKKDITYGDALLEKKTPSSHRFRGLTIPSPNPYTNISVYDQSENRLIRSLTKLRNCDYSCESNYKGSRMFRSLVKTSDKYGPMGSYLRVISSSPDTARDIMLEIPDFNLLEKSFIKAIGSILSKGSSNQSSSPQTITHNIASLALYIAFGSKKAKMESYLSKTHKADLVLDIKGHKVVIEVASNVKAKERDLLERYKDLELPLGFSVLIINKYFLTPQSAMCIIPEVYLFSRLSETRPSDLYKFLTAQQFRMIKKFSEVKKMGHYMDKELVSKRLLDLMSDSNVMLELSKRAKNMLCARAISKAKKTESKMTDTERDSLQNHISSLCSALKHSMNFNYSSSHFLPDNNDAVDLMTWVEKASSDLNSRLTGIDSKQTEEHMLYRVSPHISDFELEPKKVSREDPLRQSYDILTVYMYLMSRYYGYVERVPDMGLKKEIRDKLDKMIKIYGSSEKSLKHIKREISTHAKPNAIKFKIRDLSSDTMSLAEISVVVRACILLKKIDNRTTEREREMLDDDDYFTNKLLLDLSSGSIDICLENMTSLREEQEALIRKQLSHLAEHERNDDFIYLGNSLDSKVMTKLKYANKCKECRDTSNMLLENKNLLTFSILMYCRLTGNSQADVINNMAIMPPDSADTPEAAKADTKSEDVRYNLICPVSFFQRHVNAGTVRRALGHNASCLSKLDGQISYVANLTKDFKDMKLLSVVIEKNLSKKLSKRAMDLISKVDEGKPAVHKRYSEITSILKDAFTEKYTSLEDYTDEEGILYQPSDDSKNISITKGNYINIHMNTDFIDLSSRIQNGHEILSLLANSRDFAEAEIKKEIAIKISNHRNSDSDILMDMSRYGINVVVRLFGQPNSKDSGHCLVSYSKEGKCLRFEKWNYSDIIHYSVAPDRMFSALAALLTSCGHLLNSEKMSEIFDIYSSLILSNSWGLSKPLKVFRYLVQNCCAASTSLKETFGKFIDELANLSNGILMVREEYRGKEAIYLLMEKMSLMTLKKGTTPFFSLPEVKLGFETCLINLCCPTTVNSKRHLANVMRDTAEERDLSIANFRNIHELYKDATTIISDIKLYNKISYSRSRIEYKASENKLHNNLHEGKCKFCHNSVDLDLEKKQTFYKIRKEVSEFRHVELDVRGPLDRGLSRCFPNENDYSLKKVDSSVSFNEVLVRSIDRSCCIVRLERNMDAVLKRSISDHLDMIDKLSTKSSGRFTFSPVSIALIYENAKDSSDSVKKDLRSCPSFKSMSTARSSFDPTTKKTCSSAISMMKLCKTYDTLDPLVMSLRILSSRVWIDTTFKMFDKDQLGGDREISIMSSQMRALQSMCERTCRKMSKRTGIDMLDDDKKVKKVSEGFSSTVDLKSIYFSADQTRWGPNFNTITFSLMLWVMSKSNTQCYLPSVIAAVCETKMFETSYKLDDIEDQTDVCVTVPALLGRFHMGQGIFHFASSYYHSLVSRTVTQIINRVVSIMCPGRGVSSKEFVTSDDLLLMLTILGIREDLKTDILDEVSREFDKMVGAYPRKSDLFLIGNKVDFMSTRLMNILTSCIKRVICEDQDNNMRMTDITDDDIKKMMETTDPDLLVNDIMNTKNINALSPQFQITVADKIKKSFNENDSGDNIDIYFERNTDVSFERSISDLKRAYMDFVSKYLRNVVPLFSKGSLNPKSLVTYFLKEYSKSLMVYFGIKSSDYKNVISRKSCEFNTFYLFEKGIANLDLKFSFSLLDPRTTGDFILDLLSAYSTFTNCINSGCEEDFSVILSLLKIRLVYNMWRINHLDRRYPSASRLKEGTREIIPLSKSNEILHKSVLRFKTLNNVEKHFNLLEDQMSPDIHECFSRISGIMSSQKTRSDTLKCHFVKMRSSASYKAQIFRDSAILEFDKVTILKSICRDGTIVSVQHLIPNKYSVQGVTEKKDYVKVGKKSRGKFHYVHFRKNRLSKINQKGLVSSMISYQDIDHRSELEEIKKHVFLMENPPEFAINPDVFLGICLDEAIDTVTTFVQREIPEYGNCGKLVFVDSNSTFRYYERYDVSMDISLSRRNEFKLKTVGKDINNEFSPIFFNFGSYCTGRSANRPALFDLSNEIDETTVVLDPIAITKDYDEILENHLILNESILLEHTGYYMKSEKSKSNKMLNKIKRDLFFSRVVEAVVSDVMELNSTKKIIESISSEKKTNDEISQLSEEELISRKSRVNHQRSVIKTYVDLYCEDDKDTTSAASLLMDLEVESSIINQKIRDFRMMDQDLLSEEVSGAEEDHDQVSGTPEDESVKRLRDIAVLSDIILSGKFDYFSVSERLSNSEDLSSILSLLFDYQTGADEIEQWVRCELEVEQEKDKRASNAESQWLLSESDSSDSDPAEGDPELSQDTGCVDKEIIMVRESSDMTMWKFLRTQAVAASIYKKLSDSGSIKFATSRALQSTQTRKDKTLTSDYLFSKIEFDVPALCDDGSTINSMGAQEARVMVERSCINKANRLLSSENGKRDGQGNHLDCIDMIDDCLMSKMDNTSYSAKMSKGGADLNSMLPLPEMGCIKELRAFPSCSIKQVNGSNIVFENVNLNFCFLYAMGLLDEIFVITNKNNHDVICGIMDDDMKSLCMSIKLITDHIDYERDMICQDNKLNIMLSYTGESVSSKLVDLINEGDDEISDSMLLDEEEYIRKLFMM